MEPLYYLFIDRRKERTCYQTTVAMVNKSLSSSHFVTHSTLPLATHMYPIDDTYTPDWDQSAGGRYLFMRLTWSVVGVKPERYRSAIKGQ